MPMKLETQEIVQTVDKRMHSFEDFAEQLAAKLATRHRHVCVLLGAGASKACGLPDVAGLQEALLKNLDEQDAAHLRQLLEGRNIEQVLSRLRRIATLDAGSDKINGLTSGEAQALDGRICKGIVDVLASSAPELAPMRSLASWMLRAPYERPLEVFTVNYDLLLETALDELAVPYFDGFVGNLRAAFRADLVDDSYEASSSTVPRLFSRLWKLHGSLNWVQEGNRVIRLGVPCSNGAPAAIYPSDSKYEESRRIPFLVLQDRFRRALEAPETILMISGYSFGDQHLNEMIYDAARRRPRSEFLAFCFGAIPSDVADRAKAIPNFQVLGPEEAIIGGVVAKWSGPDGGPHKLSGNENLGDFAALANLLNQGTGNDTRGEERSLAESVS